MVSDVPENLAVIVEKLRSRYGAIDKSRFIAQIVKGRNLFEFIVAVMLSQNTSDVNAIEAYNELKNLLSGEVTPEKVLNTSLDDLIKAIRKAGMYRQRAMRIKELASLFTNKDFVEELVKAVREGDVEIAREKLMSLPGVGAKTADVVLLMYFGKPTFPVDTHITRITLRLGFVDKRDYESIRRFWMKVLDPRDYLEAHLLLITHGRETCKARKPLCSECVIREYCRYFSEAREAGNKVL